jgi:tRNA dimethylallyltransferase
MSSTNSVLVLVGPTASGKTGLAVRLAERMSGDVVSADSRQIFKHLNIGTAKPAPEELHRVPHHFIDVFDPGREYSAGRYGQEARAKISELLAQGRQPILVGGSGLYVRAVIDGFFPGPGKNEEIREQLENEARALGPEALLDKLRGLDPDAAAKMDATNARRIIRALEVYYTTGQPISRLQKMQQTKPAFGVVQFGLEWNRQELYERIDRRVDRMLRDGLVDEVKQLIAKGYSRKINALNTVGYKEVFDFLDGAITESEMSELIKRNTRRFAKRQLTWFRADKRIRWIAVDDRSDWAQIVQKILEEFRTAQEAIRSSN